MDKDSFADQGVLRGKAVDYILKFMLPRNYINNAQIPENWNQPILFYEGTIRLCQISAGPCGVFAALQSHVILQHQSNRENEPIILLIFSIIDIMNKLNPGVFSLVTYVDLGEKRIDIFTTTSQEIFTQYILRTDFFNQPFAIFLLSLSFVYTAGPEKLSSYAFPETFIDDDGNTDIHFVTLLIRGEAIDSVSDEYTIYSGSLNSCATSKMSIGIIQLYENERSLLPAGANVSDSLLRNWVVYNGEHFYSVVLERGNFYVFDPFIKDIAPSKVLEQDHPIYVKLMELAQKFGIDFS
ncbi:hypothetical protein GPJ56_004935 [Histomonas meleagridis]|uniref:uncharacterized protein n=1 Tax=Histomonas meleagridis TaxID=135588 RepID=UPI00355ABC39|nr:hypothetical protein GPJ56_004935 [Histomonas meleagridis]KAH0798539.1 hypothetical protein GO595_008404 [Histomonas meleagridis]